MSQVCAICGKHPGIGHQVARRGKAKYLGGVGRKITGITKRQFKPNLQRVRVFQDGTVRRLRVCTQCLRSGKVIKPPARPEAAKAAAIAAARPKVEPEPVAVQAPAVETAEAPVSEAALETPPTPEASDSSEPAAPED